MARPSPTTLACLGPLRVDDMSYTRILTSTSATSLVLHASHVEYITTDCDYRSTCFTSVECLGMRSLRSATRIPTVPRSATPVSSTIQHQERGRNINMAFAVARVIDRLPSFVIPSEASLDPPESYVLRHDSLVVLCGLMLLVSLCWTTTSSFRKDAWIKR